MTADQIVEQLRAMGNESTKRVLMRHGAREPFFGVKIEDLKKIQKREKTNYQLALDLWATGISDAMYLAGLIADDPQMTRKDIQRWADEAYWHMLSGYPVAWVASGSSFGRDLALKWIDSKRENLGVSGWSTLAYLTILKDDQDLDLKELKQLLNRVKKTIHVEQNLVRYAMNGFLIALGASVASLTEATIKTAEAIGPVHVDMGETACKVPVAADAIRKIQSRGTIGKKRKSVRC